MKHKVITRNFKGEWGNRWGQDLGQFLNDPKSNLNRYDDVPTNIEAVQGRLYGTLGRLMAKLVEKGVLSVDEVLEISDINWEKNKQYKVVPQDE